jgi:hypothetical protein
MEWIKCSEKLPEIPGIYLVWFAEGVSVCKWYGMNSEDRPYENTGWRLPYQFTYWMPLPKPPKEE